MEVTAVVISIEKSNKRTASTKNASIPLLNARLIENHRLIEEGRRAIKLSSRRGGGGKSVSLI